MIGWQPRSPHSNGVFSGSAAVFIAKASSISPQVVIDLAPADSAVAATVVARKTSMTTATEAGARSD